MYSVLKMVFYTHTQANNYILKGITRSVVLECANEIGLPVKEEAFTKTAAFAMDELFVTSTTSEVTPVISIDETNINGGKVGDWTRKLQAQFETKIPKSLQVK